VVEVSLHAPKQTLFVQKGQPKLALSVLVSYVSIYA
jgi:hypothetical protein